MKKSRFITLVVTLLLGFWIVIYQNYKIFNYVNVVDYRTADIYKYLEWDKEITNEIKDLDKKVDWLQNSVHGYWALIYRIVEYME